MMTIINICIESHREINNKNWMAFGEVMGKHSVAPIMPQSIQWLTFCAML